MKLTGMHRTMRRLKPPPTALAPLGCVTKWQQLILKKLFALEAIIASKPFQPLLAIEGNTFLQIAVTDSSLAVSSLCLEEQRAVTHRYSLPCDWDPSGGGTFGASMFTKVDEIVHMVEYLENHFSVFTFFNASSETLRLTEFLNSQRKISRKLRIIFELLHDWEVVKIKDCEFIQIGHSNSFTFRNDFMKRVISYNSVEGVDTVFKMLLQRNQEFFNRYATYGAPVSHCSLELVCHSVVQLKAHHAEFEYTQSSLEANFCHSMIHFKGNQVALAPSLLDANFCHSMIHLKGNQVVLAPSLLDANFCHSIVYLKGNQTDLALRLLQGHICRSLIRSNGNQVELVLSLLQGHICRSLIRSNGNQVELVLSLLQGHICRSLIRSNGNQVELVLSLLQGHICHSLIRLTGNKVDLIQSSLEALVGLLAIRLTGNKVALIQSSLEALVRLSAIRLTGNKVALNQSSLEALVRLSAIRLTGNKVALIQSSLEALVRLSAIRLTGNKVALNQSSLEALVRLSAIRLTGNKVALAQSSLEALVGLSAIRLTGNKVELFDTALFCRGKEHATILSSRVHAMIAKPRIYRLPFRQKCVGDEDLPHVADPENPLQLRADDVDGRTEDDNDYTDKKDEVLAESFAVIRGQLRDIRNCLTRLSEAKPTVTFNLIRCKHVQIGEINEMSFVYDEDLLDSASAD